MTVLGKALDMAAKRYDLAGAYRYTIVDRCRSHDPKGYRRRHLRLLKDGAGDLYVRIGKHAAHKRYLKDMAGADIVDESLCLVVFFESAP